MFSERLITLDCVIFGLQSFGGISNYWSKLVQHISADLAGVTRLILPKHMRYRDFDDAYLRGVLSLREGLDTRIGRYLPVATNAVEDIFHTSYYRIPIQKPRNYVVSVYDFTYERYRTGFPRLVHARQKSASIRRADTVLCISESTRRDVLEFLPDIDPSKLHVVYLGVDPNHFYQDPAVRFFPYHQTVLFVGQRFGYKRFDLAVEAVRQSPRLSLGVAGPSLTKEERKFLQDRLDNRWHEFGPVSTADLRRIYSSVFAFIFPSDYEGFGLPLLEAMACGCPVVAASLSSLPEIGGGAACYAERQTGESYASALASLESSTVRETVIRRGKVRAEQFKWHQTIQNTKAIYLAR
jgi:mannosyltransferase